MGVIGPNPRWEESPIPEPIQQPEPVTVPEPVAVPEREPEGVPA